MINHDSTLQLISLALDASVMRQAAIARNIANANTLNYQTVTVNFEQQFTQTPMLTKTFDETGTSQPCYQTSTARSPIDEQLALSVKNATQFRALIKGLNHKLAIMNLALQGHHSS